MLTLNTNQGGLAKKNNHFLGSSYPDFESILIKPDNGFQNDGILEITNIVSGPAFVSVQGTKINFPTSNLYEPFYQGVSGQKFGSGGTFSIKRNQSGSIRVGAISPLEGGEIIGKFMCAKRIPFLYQQTARTVTMTIEVKLLHTNGTLTSVGTMSGTYTGDGEYNAWKENPGQFISTKTNGVVAQKGDLVVCDILFTGGVASASSYQNGFSFGRDGGNACPIQISVE